LFLEFVRPVLDLHASLCEGHPLHNLGGEFGDFVIDLVWLLGSILGDGRWALW
jgi:hypothetical protein